MVEISNLGYLVLQVSELASWQSFAVDTIGLMAARSVSGRTLALRMDRLEQRIVLEQGSLDDLVAAGWELDSEKDLDAYVDQLKRSGAAVVAGSRELAMERRVEKIYTLDDPVGFRHEFYFGAAVALISNPFRSKVLVGNFLTGRLGVGHFVCVARDYGVSVKFYRETLGLRISDYIRHEVEPGVVVADVTFFHSTTGRHHSLATAGPSPALSGNKRLNHLMVEVDNMNDVGLAFDRCIAAKAPIHWGIGHHPNDQMCSFYVHTPSGFGLEFGYGGIVINDTDWKPVSYNRFSDWGHEPRPRA